MKINFYSLPGYTVSFLKESALPSLSAHQKKIILIATVALGIFAAAWIIARHYCFKGQPVEIKDQPKDQDQQHVLMEPFLDDEVGDNEKEDSPQAVDEEDLRIILETATDHNAKPLTPPEEPVAEMEFKQEQLEAETPSPKKLKEEVEDKPLPLEEKKAEPEIPDEIDPSEKIELMPPATDPEPTKTAYPDGSVAEGELIDGKLHGKGKITFSQGYLWEGEFKEGLLHGPGKITLPGKNAAIREGIFENGTLLTVNAGQKRETKITLDGCVAEGEFKEGQLHGKGIRLFPDQKREQGQFIEGQLNGQGIRVIPGVGTIQGQFIAGELIKGKITEENGDVLEGEFTDNLLHGPGKRTKKNSTIEKGIFEKGVLIKLESLTDSYGSVAEGEFKDGKLHGHGKMKYYDGTVTEGEFKEGQLHGKGKRIFKNWYSWEGEFKEGLLHGQGKITIPGKSLTIREGIFDEGVLVTTIDSNQTRETKTYLGGTVAEGEFKDGKLHGDGWQHYSNRTLEKGQFKNGLLDGQGEKINADFGNAIYKGEFKEGQLHGIGSESVPNWHKSEGQYENGRLIKGKITLSNGEVSEGEFKDGKLHGPGKITWPGGSVHEGVFKEGNLIQPKK